VVGATLYFNATNNFGSQLWKTDGTTAGTTMVADLNGTAGSNPQNLINDNGTLFFSAFTAQYGTELWKTDGTASGTVMVQDIYPGSTGSSPGNFVVFGTTLVFSAADPTHSSRLWWI
jgi:ELWxxDGT repeat protein